MKEHNANSIVNTPSFPSLAEAIQTLYGNNIRIETRRSVSGGDCNDAYELQFGASYLSSVRRILQRFS